MKLWWHCSNSDLFSCLAVWTLFEERHGSAPCRQMKVDCWIFLFHRTSLSLSADLELISYVLTTNGQFLITSHDMHLQLLFVSTHLFQSETLQLCLFLICIKKEVFLPLKMLLCGWCLFRVWNKHFYASRNVTWSIGVRIYFHLLLFVNCKVRISIFDLEKQKSKESNLGLLS